MKTAPTGALTYLVRAAGILAMAIGFRIGLQLWMASGANNGFERLTILSGGLLMLICTGFAAGQAALGLQALLRRRSGR